MADISIIKLKVRRGSDAQRQLVILDQGELGYTIDTKRLFAGTGTLSGGEVVGAKIHPPVTNTASLTSINAQVGDLCYAKSLLYQLTAASYNTTDSWKYIGTVPDNTTLALDSTNSLYLKDNSITSSKLSSTLLGSGMETVGVELRVKLNSAHLELSGSTVSIKQSGITSREVSTAALSSGLVGGNSEPIKVKVDGALGFTSSGALTLCTFPAGSVVYASLDAALQAQLDSGLTSVDGDTISRSGGGVLSLTPLISAIGAEVHLASVLTDAYGRVVQMTTSITDAMTGLSAVSSFSGAASALTYQFTGAPEAGGRTVLGGSQFVVLSTNADRSATVHVTLSAGGFITFGRQQAESTRQIADESMGYTGFAIPIFIF